MTDRSTRTTYWNGYSGWSWAALAVVAAVLFASIGGVPGTFIASLAEFVIVLGSGGLLAWFALRAYYARGRQQTGQSVQFGLILTAILPVLFAVMYDIGQLTQLNNLGPPPYGYASPNFLDDLVFSVSTWVTLGSGYVYPTGLGRIFASVEAMYGYAMLPIWAAILVKMFQEASREPRELRWSSFFARRSRW